MAMRFIFIFIFFVILVQEGLSFNSDTGTTRGAFLKWNNGVRSSAMGNTYIAAADDAGGIYFNPGGISWTDEAELYTTYSNWFAGAASANISSILPINKMTLGFSYDYADFGKIGEATTLNPQGTGNFFNPMANVLTLTIAQKISLGLSLGTNFKLINEDIGGSREFGYGLDIGGLWKAADIFAVGFNAKNIIGNLGGGTIPKNYGVGVSTKFDKFLIGLDANFPNDDLYNLSIGGEYNYKDMLFFRSGYLSKVELPLNKLISDAKGGISLGLGVKHRGIKIDYAYVPYGDLGQTHKIAVSLPFFKYKSKLSEIEIFPKDVKVNIGKVHKFYALGYDNRLNIVAFEPLWKVKSKIGKITENGIFTGTGTGEGEITVMHEMVEGKTKVTVFKVEVAKKALKKDTPAKKQLKKQNY